MNQSPIKPEQARTDRHIEAFLRALNAADAFLVGSLPLAQSRQVLTDVQKSLAIDMSGVEESEQIIIVDGQPLSLNIVRPANTAGALPTFVFSRWQLGSRRLFYPQAFGARSGGRQRCRGGVCQLYPFAGSALSCRN